MKWITREHPKIDRIACPWLILRFVDPEAEIIYAPFDQVVERAAELGAISFDIPSVEYTHYGSECTFDFIIRKHKITDTAVLAMAPIVRAADTDHHELAPQAAGLWAISAGLAYNNKDDYELLKTGMVIYYALYSWAKHLQHVTHLQNPFENLLLEVLDKLNKEGVPGRMPSWVKELKHLIQDQIDTNITLKELSKDLDINPSYLSRTFSKHFDNLSFGDYIRKQRIERAIEFMRTATYSLTEIAYLTGFSDQSHFNRIFKKETGENPSAYRKKIIGKK